MSEDWTLLVDFTRAIDARGWFVVDDGVMGGVSYGALAPAPDGLGFTGSLSLDRGGGFVSCRGPLPRPLPERARLRVVLRGDGRRWQFRLKPGHDIDGSAWRAEFDTVAGCWTMHAFAVADFVPVFRGRVLRSDAPLSLPSIGQVGFLLADRRPGPFALRLGRIEIATAGATQEPGGPARHRGHQRSQAGSQASSQTVSSLPK